MSLTIDFSGEVAGVPKRLLNPGSWYLGFACRQCGAMLALLDDPTDTGKTTVFGTGKFTLECPACGERNEYHTSGNACVPGDHWRRDGADIAPLPGRKSRQGVGTVGKFRPFQTRADQQQFSPQSARRDGQGEVRPARRASFSQERI